MSGKPKANAEILAYLQESAILVNAELSKAMELLDRYELDLGDSGDQGQSQYWRSKLYEMRLGLSRFESSLISLRFYGSEDNE